MSTLDIILLIPLAWGAFKGFKKGLIGEIASILALLLGVYGAFKMSSYAIPYIQEFISVSDYWISIVAFVLVFLVIILLVFLLGKFLEWGVSFIALGFANKIGGTAFGLLKYVFLISVLLTFLIPVNNTFKLLSNDVLKESVLFAPVSKVAPFLLPIIKDSQIYEPIKKGADEVLGKKSNE